MSDDESNGFGRKPLDDATGPRSPRAHSSEHLMRSDRRVGSTPTATGAVGLGLGIGLGFGAVMGLVIQQLGVGLALGIGIGIALGMAFIVAVDGE